MKKNTKQGVNYIIKRYKKNLKEAEKYLRSWKNLNSYVKKNRKGKIFTIEKTFTIDLEKEIYYIIRESGIYIKVLKNEIKSLEDAVKKTWKRK